MHFHYADSPDERRGIAPGAMCILESRGLGFSVSSDRYLLGMEDRDYYREIYSTQSLLGRDSTLSGVICDGEILAHSGGENSQWHYQIQRKRSIFRIEIVRAVIEREFEEPMTKVWTKLMMTSFSKTQIQTGQLDKNFGVHLKSSPELIKNKEFRIYGCGAEDIYKIRYSSQQIIRTT